MLEEFNSTHVTFNKTKLKQNSNKNKQPKIRFLETAIAMWRHATNKTVYVSHVSKQTKGVECQVKKNDYITITS